MNLKYLVLPLMFATLNANSQDLSRYERTLNLYDYQHAMPGLRVINDSKDGTLTKNVTSANTIIIMVGRVLACSDQPTAELKAFNRPKYTYALLSIKRSDQNHDQNTCLKITDLSARKINDDSFSIEYTFRSLTSGNTKKATTNFTILGENWYIY